MHFEFDDKDLWTLYHKGVGEPARKRVARRFPPRVVEAFCRAVDAIEAVESLTELGGYHGMGLHPLKGNRADQWAVRLNIQYRLVFRIVALDPGRMVLIIEIVDYH